MAKLQLSEHFLKKKGVTFFKRRAFAIFGELPHLQIHVSSLL